MNNPLELPEKIKVKIEKCGHGKFLIALPDYQVHTQADSELELISIVNDLIFCVLNIPKEFKSKIYYKPIKEGKDYERAKPFIRLTSIDIVRKYLN